MCGICGIINYNESGEVDRKVLNAMCSAMAHRGPDDEGIYLNEAKPSAGLGHRRLSIIDLSGAGHQPMSNEDGSAWVVFNGEIYNYKDLRFELEKKGHRFKSNSDTETIIHLYEDYGEECVEYLRGMFAFAIWDGKKEILLLARDRPGKKPLLYYQGGGKFCFASEFDSLLKSGFVEKKINYDAIHHYLTFGYIPAPLTIYDKVYKLLPAHTLILKENKITLRRYWELDYSKKIIISEGDAAEETLRLLKESVGCRLYSDVALGAFLSGGIDSSSIVSLMSQLSVNRVKTFSIGFEEKNYSELRYARAIAKTFNIEHHEFIVKPKVLEILPLLVERYGEPYADSSCIPTYYVSRETKKFVTVALSGDGGDESFAGYERYQAMLLANAYRRAPKFARKAAEYFSAILPDSVDSKNKLHRIKRFFSHAKLPTTQRYARWISMLGKVMDRDFYSEGYLKKISQVDPLKIIEPYLKNSMDLSLMDGLLMTDVHTYLPNDLLVKVDIASMANSLEVRSPFLDHKLMEFAAKLPPEYKMRRTVKKYILKKAVKDLIPQKNIDRRKMGFAVPVGKWLRGELKDFLRETLLSKTSLRRGYFKPPVIKTMVEQHISMRKDYSFQLWALLMLELWHRKFADSQKI